jgi:hypothetical protein
MQMKVLEKDIQRAILDYCKAHRLFVQRRNVAGVQKLNGGRYVKLGTRGMSDLWGIKNGTHWECEVKRPGCEPSDFQIAWLNDCQAAGARAFWCDSLDCFIEMIGSI